MSQVIAITACPVPPVCYFYTLETSGTVEYTDCAGTYTITYMFSNTTVCAQNVITGDWIGPGSECT
jgi:hypothetical protein